MFTSPKSQIEVLGFVLLIAGLNLLLTTVAESAQRSGTYGFGSVASANEVQAVDIAVGPDGDGLPPGQGAVAEGAAVYKAQCASCHGPSGIEGPRSRLVGGELPVKTIGSYWPYATTIFDYIRRAMPIPKPGALTNQQVYALTAWLLYQNKIIAADAVMDAQTLPQVHMPNREGFINDPRPDTR